MNLELAGLVALAIVVYALYRYASAQRGRKAAAARSQTMLKICAANGGVPGPVDIPGMFDLLNNGIAHGLTNEFSNAADFWYREDKATRYFTFVTAHFPGLDMRHIAVTRKGLPGTAVWGPGRIEVESIAFTERFTVTAADKRTGFMLLDLPMIEWILECADVNFEMFANGLLAYVYRAEEGGGLLNVPLGLEARPLNTDGSELELLYRFVAGFGERIPAVLKAEFAARAQ